MKEKKCCQNSQHDIKWMLNDQEEYVPYVTVCKNCKKIIYDWERGIYVSTAS